MNFLTDQVKKFSDNKPEDVKPEDAPTHKPTSSAELASSAKIVADAAQAAARNDTANLDKGKVAGAAADLLEAARTYGKLDEKSGVGQYLDKAEKYLHQFETSHHSSTTTTATDTAAPVADPPAGESAGKKDDGDSGSGLGDYMKMAQGFMNK